MSLIAAAWASSVGNPARIMRLRMRRRARVSALTPAPQLGVSLSQLYYKKLMANYSRPREPLRSAKVRSYAATKPSV